MEANELSPVGAWVRDAIRALVNDPQAVELRELRGSEVSMLEVEVSRSTFGQAVGRGGRLADALRQLLACVGGASRRKYTLHVLEPGETTSPTSPSPKPSQEEMIELTRSLMERLIAMMVDNRESLQVTTVRGYTTVLVCVYVVPSEVRRVIGRNGQAADAIRALLHSLGSKAGLRFELDLEEPLRPESP